LEDDNENLEKASDFFGGINTRETSKVTHQAIYHDMLSTLMERALEIENIIAKKEDLLDEIEDRIELLEKKSNILIVFAWFFIVIVIVFCVVAITL
jgi:hypothetical protein